MTLVGVSRVIPSGKVYRQVFDDEVQLVRALGEARNKISHPKVPPCPGKIPLVRDVETCSGKKFLSHRQQTWVEGMPNDEVTENPVLYKEATILEQQKAKESEDVIAAREVRGLADVIVPEKKNSSIIERISENRRCQYNTAVATLRQELAHIGKEMERYILEPGVLFLTKLSESDKAIESLFIRAEDDSDLETCTVQDFEEVWELVFQQTLQRRQWIRELDQELLKAEWRRTELIKALLKKYTKILEDSAYLLSADIHRFIHSEAMMINQALLANRRAIGRLYVNLMEADLKREVVQRYRLEERLNIWKAVQKEAIISSFREFMESDRIQNPSAVRAELENMLREQLSLREKRRELLYSLGNFLPLSSPSKAEINEWNASLVALNKQIDTSNVQYMMRIRIQYEKVCQECLSTVQECKQKLLEMKICTEKEAEKVVNPSLFQLVGKLQSRFENEMEMMDNDFEQLVKHSEVNCRHLYQYFQDALLLFDMHQQKVSQQENDLHHKMNDCRNKHEGLNKLREVNLDMSVDRLRTQSTDEKLKAQLEKVYAALEFIRAGYDTFHQDLMTRVNLYPELVLRKLISYSISVSRYFYVKQVYRGKPFEKAEVAVDKEMAEEEEEELEELEESVEGVPEQGSEESELQEEEEEEEKTPKEETDETTKVEEVEQNTKLGELGGSNQGSYVEGFAGDEVLGSDRDRSETGSFILQEAGDTPEAEEAAETETPRASTTQSEAAVEYFTTSSGNTYKAAAFVRKSKAKRSEKYYAGKLNEDILPTHLEQVYLSQGFFADLRRHIRLQFFEHLEKWFEQTLSHAWIIVAAEREELKSELRLRIHLHEPRQGRVEKDVYRVRMAELRLHNERLVRHCAGVVQALNKEKESFLKLREDQNSVSRAFQQRIQDMENIFLVESRADKLLSLSNNLHGELVNHMEVMQVSLRSYRQYLEESLGKLRDANTDFLKACKLFSDGGNFSPEEVENLMKSLEKESERIDFVEGLIMIDLEKMESTYMEQATEVITKFESRFRYLALDRVFMEKMQRFLTNVQVKIKSEVAKSNFQTKTINSHLENLICKIDACAYPTVDKESITPEGLLELATFVIEELRKRTHYLDCLLGLDATYSISEAQESGGTTSLVVTESFLQEPKVIVMGMESTPLMNPSRMGKSVFEDSAIGVIKNLLGIQRYKKMLEPQSDKEEGFLGTADPSLGSYPAESTQGTAAHSIAVPSVKVSCSIVKRVSGSVVSMQRYTKMSRTEKKVQILGNRLKDSDFSNFKGIIFGIVWDSFDILMTVAEEFYRKEKHQITRPDFLQDTYDQCIEAMGQKLLLYVNQTDEYHIACISEFRDQLKRFEGLLPDVTKLVIGKYLKDYEQLLMDSMGQIRRNLQEQLQKWDLEKDENKHQLCPSLGHPDNIPQLEALCQVEEERQKEQEEGVYQCTHKLQTCLIECTQKFVSALASCTEKVLLQLDDCLTVDDIQLGRIETPREKTTTLIRRKRAGLSLEVDASKLAAERGSRTWPGIPRTTLAGLSNQIICRETASVTTSKTTLGHVAAVEERDAVYVKFKQMIEMEFAKITEESTVHLMKAQHWADWWRKSVQKIKRLYA
ncbi:coiled-coil domain-containing protein 180 [Tiliqua scincoides]|uniref:coiled-coil domain-containing protein 180 n=1 Tax=Tiliqua scincoides TaxID=71010 RepID=UPI003463148A